jgi:hypothetical protein
MKKELYLSLVVVALLCLAGLAGYGQRTSSVRQTWEYKTILRSRGFAAAEENVQRAGEWDSWSEDGKRLPSPVDIRAKLTQLGEQGWELVSVTPRSSVLGGHETTDDGGVSSDYAGFTSDETWVFKRLKP